MSANYLPVQVLKYAALPMPKYFSFLDKLMQTLPVINANGIMDEDGNCYYRGEMNPYSECLEKYEILQYNNVMDVSNTLKSMYKVVN